MFTGDLWAVKSFPHIISQAQTLQHLFLTPILRTSSPTHLLGFLKNTIEKHLTWEWAHSHARPWPCMQSDNICWQTALTTTENINMQLSTQTDSYLFCLCCPVYKMYDYVSSCTNGWIKLAEDAVLQPVDSACGMLWGMHVFKRSLIILVNIDSLYELISLLRIVSLGAVFECCLTEMWSLIAPHAYMLSDPLVKE